MDRTIDNRGAVAGRERTNINGKSFEDDVFEYIKAKVIGAGFELQDIKKQVDKLKNNNEIYHIIKNGETIGLLGTQGEIFNYFDKQEFLTKWIKKELKEVPKNIKDVWEKNIVTDIFIINFKNQDRFINFFEIKYQNDSGSVDEKLQTGLFKRKMWQKLFKNILDEGAQVHYEYILSNWYSQKSKKGTNQLYYQDTFNYLSEPNINIPFYINQSKDFQDKYKDGRPVYKKDSKTKISQAYLSAPVILDDFNIEKYL